MTAKPWEEILDRLDVLAFYGSEHVDLRPHGDTYATGLCPFHDDKQASLSVSLETGKRGMFRCHGCGEKGSPFDFYQKKHNVDFPSSLREVVKFAPGVVIEDRASSASRGAVAATYVYTDDQDRPVHRTVRFQPKSFVQQRYENGEWKYGLRGVNPVLYHLPEVRAAMTAGKVIFIVEGEKDADNVRALVGGTATTSPMGAGKWRQEYTDALAGADVVLIPDNDTMGRKHMQAVAHALQEASCKVRVLDLPGIPAKGDVSDWIAMGGDAQTLAFLVTQAKEWKPLKAGPVLTRMNTVVPKDVDWVWDQHIPRGKLSLIVGDPGLGKSTVALDIASRISRGSAWPDGGTATKGDILVLMAEDGLEDTIAPRLLRLGADSSRVIAMTGVREDTGQERFFTLDKDLAHVAAAIEEIQPQVVIIDPINAYMGDVDAHQDVQVRRILNPIQDLADRYNIAVIAVMHLNKNTQTKADYRVGGSIAYTAAARSVTYVVPDKEEEDKRYFITHKMNLARRPAPLAFRLNGSLEWDPDPVQGIDLEELLVSRSNQEDSGQLHDAIDFLEAEIPSGSQVPSVDVYKRARENGIADRTLKRAKAALDWIVSRKVGDTWFFIRKGTVPGGPLGTVGPLGPLGTLAPDQGGQTPDQGGQLETGISDITEEKREGGQGGQEYQEGQGGHESAQEGQDDDLPHWNRG